MSKSGGYKVECFVDNCWHHRIWRKSEIAAVAIAEVESQSRKLTYRVKFEHKIICLVNKDGKREI